MHMADALISPLVGGVMWAATAAITAYSARKLDAGGDDRVVPLMGVLGAFIFAAQMINFSIPGTGSSGHLGGGMILSILLGPYAAFLTMASVLTVQALFFADGGLLALGCNIFNLAFFPCFVAYPLLYRTIAGAHASEKRILVASLVAVIAGLQLGALAVVLQTFFSGVSELPFATFLLLMLPIHLAIGIVEGLLTAAIVTVVGRARPEVLASAAALPATPRPGRGRLLAQLLLLTAVTGGLLSWFASTRMDGLEWAIFHSSGKEALPAPATDAHALAATLQERTALLPDYAFRPAAEEGDAAEPAAEVAAAGSGKEKEWPDVSAGTSFAGLLGATLSMLLAGLLGFALLRLRQRR
ncbi:energy-coupling factor ABC transporter permease [Accumulibacter sp.]|uniref:energy-coupling factor ABC transporter permease n=1 Tax=Accumulibacter sp. TaxID=2053492 RepID=UPI0025F0230D|nr:energy-coupling factor ABC transporter permease [Accumulibacter sp.]MCM8611253.1 energy-coupling factor ABC transporter permease [Accumulibacter sp.]MCM8635334.1 energy-coupling factor ABC transporter permease [Accumulibacter sp.]MCM8638735.1 energy-coupling factor ABC transporter permease [Accumulibacter sp.]